ncbi:endoplasmic reticulum aminopeptidase 2-like isoform X3 [Montipora foliosa]|uniref:endoplasmic reticulum aminopeptidase 2-like isoform X3 n=1 Tax=Montipora foliosa TaxID=591990 RepID=UPI0035F1F250
METEEDDFSMGEPKDGGHSSGENLFSWLYFKTSTPIHRLIVKAVFFSLSLVFAVVLVLIFLQHDFLPLFTEHARELSKHRSREDGVEFKIVDTMEKLARANRGRLPRDIQPLTYNLDLRVNLTTLRYCGVVKIKMLCKSATRFVILHSKDLDILDVSMTQAYEIPPVETLTVQRILLFKRNQQLCVEFFKRLRKGEMYVLNLRFKSKISNRLEGFYKSYYTNKHGEKRALAMTYFEPAHARKVFPCFDEPSFKASFIVSITRDSGSYYALSNMPRARLVHRKDGLVEEHFAPSVNMSSYLVAFAVLDFKWKEKKTDSGVAVRIHAPASDYDRLDYALDSAVKVLSYYEKLFEEPYPLPKLDLLAIPDLLIGAMENWGLVTFRRVHLVYDETYSSSETKLSIIRVIAHELAHQWFGNLVTMRWWNDLWLNEGFASFIQDEFGVNHVIKSWDMRDEVVATSWLTALEADSAWSSHPISVQVYRPEDIDDIFDTISYKKRYIQDHKYGNANADDLWEAIAQENRDIDVKGMMNAWTNQKGFPIINIHKQRDKLFIKQEDFLDKISLQHDREELSYKRKTWFIPLSYMTKSNGTPRWILMPQDCKVYTLKVGPAASTDPWVMANINATGFFTVNYDEENWKKLATQLRADHKVFSPSDRAGLIHDVFSLSCQGLLDPILALNLSTYMVRELQPVPWRVARKETKCLVEVFSKNNRPLYKKFLWHLQDHLIDFLGTEDTGSDQERSFRYDVLSEAMKSGQRKDINEIFTLLFNRLKKRSFERNLLLSLDDSKVRPQDSLYWIEQINKGTSKPDPRWSFIVSNWKTLARRYGGTYKLGNLVKAVAGSFHTTKQLKMVKDTFKALPSGELALRAQKQTLEKIRRNIAGKAKLLTTKETFMVHWLQEYLRSSK